MKRSLAAAILLFAMPSLALAANAGFATQTVFLSRSQVFEGESVLIYASVSNPATSTWNGKLEYSEGGNDIGSISLSLGPQEARIVSVSWKPSAGIHTVVTTLLDKNGTEIADQSTEFSINPKPVQAMSTSTKMLAAVDSSQGIQQTVSDISPTAANISAPAFTAIDNLRQSAANALDKQLVDTKSKLPGGQVLGAATQKQSSSGGWQGSVMGILWTLYFYLLVVLRYLVGKAALFYPIFAFLFMYILYKIYKRMTRPQFY